MHLGSWHILADEDIGKVIIGILVFVLWGIGSLASMVKKANEEAKRRAIAKPKSPVAPIAASDQRMVVGGFAATPVPRPPPISPAIMQRAKAPGQKRQAIKAAQRVVPPPIAPRVATPRPQVVAQSRPVVEKVVSSAASNIARSNLGGAKAPAIRKWLVPGTLRKQFILTELFRPPIALRDEE